MTRHLPSGLRLALAVLVVAAAATYACSSGTPPRGGDGASDSGDSTTGGNPSTDAGSGSGGVDAGDSSGGSDAGDGDTGDVDGGDGDGTDGGFTVTWPTCDPATVTLPASTIADVWNENPSVLTEYWLPGVYVSAISGGACVAHQLCEFYLQQQPSFPDVATAAKQAVKVLVSANSAERFTSLRAGDQVDLDAFAIRETDAGQELIFHIQLPSTGCANKVGTGDLQPVNVDLNSLTMELYQQSMGPLFVHVDQVSGTPHAPTDTFGLYETHNYQPTDEPVSLSPFCLEGSAFTGLTAETPTGFTGVTGVFGEFIPTGEPTVFLELYPRTTDDYPLAPATP